MWGSLPSLGVKKGVKPTPVPGAEDAEDDDRDDNRFRNESSPLLTIGAPKPIDYAPREHVPQSLYLL